MGFHQVDPLKGHVSTSAYTWQRNTTRKRKKKGMEKEEMRTHVYRRVTSGKENIRTEVGQEACQTRRAPSGKRDQAAEV